MDFMSFLTGAFIGAGVMFVTMLLRRPRLDEHVHVHVWPHEPKDEADWWKAPDEDS